MGVLLYIVKVHVWNCSVFKDWICTTRVNFSWVTLLHGPILFLICIAVGLHTERLFKYICYIQYVRDRDRDRDRDRICTNIC